MKKLFAALAAGVAVLALAGCANSPVKFAPVSIPVIPPQQLALQICPLVKADLDILAGSPLVSQAQKDKLASIKPLNDAVCAAGATVDLTNLQAFNDSAFPAVISLVSAAPVPNQPAILLALQLAQPIVKQIVADAIAASKAAPAVAASTPLAGAPLQ